MRAEWHEKKHEVIFNAMEFESYDDGIEAIEELSNMLDKFVAMARDLEEKIAEGSSVAKQLKIIGKALDAYDKGEV